MGEGYLASIPGSTNPSNRSYFVNIDAPEGNDIELTVELQAINGKFRMCVSLLENITEWSQCDWKTENNKNSLIISSNDSKFVRSHKYGILVVPVYKSEYEYSNYTYVITVSNQDNYPSVVAGLVTDIVLPSSYKNYKFPVSIVSTGATILLTTADDKAKLQVSTEYKELNSPDTSTKLKTAHGQNAALYFDQKELTEMCGDKRSSVNLLNIV